MYLVVGVELKYFCQVFAVASSVYISCGSKYSKAIQVVYAAVVGGRFWERGKMLYCISYVIYILSSIESRVVRWYIDILAV
mgnify:CR=1 FL=1